MDNELKYLLRFSKVYSHPAIVLWRSIEAKLLSWVVQQMDFNNPIFDLGCGGGEVSTIIFEQQIDAGLDINLAEIKKARATNSYKTLALADACSLPFSDRTFGLVFSNCVIEHIPNIKKALTETSRVLKDKGYFIFTVPSEHFADLLFFTNLFKKLGLDKLAYWYSTKRNTLLNHYNIFSKEEWIKRLNNVNLKVVFVQEYLSKQAIQIWDLLAFLGFLSRKLGLTKLQDSLLSIPKVNRFKAKIYTRILRKYYRAEQLGLGGGLLIVAQK